MNQKIRLKNIGKLAGKSVNPVQALQVKWGRV